MTYEEILRLAPQSGLSPEEDMRILCESKVKLLNAEVGKMNLKDGVNCEVCKNKGVTYHLSDNNEIVAKRCDCLAKREQAKLRKQVGLSSTFGEKTFDDFQVTNEAQRKMKVSAEYYVKQGIDEKSWYYVSGSSGCGKTTICSCIVNALVAKGIKVKFVSWRDLLGTLKTYAMDRERVSDRLKLLRSVQNCDVLYIDDFFKTGSNGKIPPTPADICTTFDIISARYNNGLPTIISSEHSLVDIMDIDNALGGRIKEMSANYNIAIGNGTGLNYRLNF